MLKEEYSSLKHEEQTMRNLADEKEREGKRYHDNLGYDTPRLASSTLLSCASRYILLLDNGFIGYSVF